MPTRRDLLRSAGAIALVSGFSTAPRLAAFAFDNGGRGNLGAVRAITTTASDLDLIEAAYRQYLGYEPVLRGRVPSATALGWGAPAVAGARYLVLRPASGEPTYLRFVEQKRLDGYKPLTTTGWNATELLVEDVDRLFDRLKNSSFRILQPPHELRTSNEIRAMQVLGPADELLYLTCVQRPMPERDLAPARSFVDRCFIAVVGGHDLDAMIDFYQTQFGNRAGPVHDGNITALTAALALPEGTRHKLATMQLGSGSKIELDRYPDLTTERRRPPGGLPPGMAIVTFECGALSDVKAPFISKPQPAALLPHTGRPTATLHGPTGELIELTQT